MMYHGINGMDFFGSTHALGMAQINIQTISCLYPTTNTPSLTTHHTLIVCEALRYVCPCDDDRDAKEDDCDDLFLRQTNLAGNSYEMRRY